MISLIAAMGKNRVMGHGGKIPWHLSADLKHFKEITTGHPVIMGRKTYESIGRALPGRTNIVLSRNPEFAPADVVLVPSLQEAFKLTEGAGEVFVIGGAQIFQQALPLTDKLYLTIVRGDFECDTFFPDYADFKNKISEKEGESEGHKYKFLELERG